MFKDFSLGCLVLIALVILVPLGMVIFQTLFWTASQLIKLVVAVVVLIIIGRAVRMLLNR
ncbi:hypothetical protein OOT00_12710 [Desulfobotulus sp. H1]|uniref:Uncharacterized protein n=1 Tax=Desulfobotulus pelophilus TaxID=2823377 RepID=A0ABT3NBQ1_9BACT|nr:hypothetical protein [Desulfobotulus pelophilus]MCW7754845.1 hypothetical protein [Desulfobotulus pelophilus]